MKPTRSNLFLAGVLAFALLVPLAPATLSQPACDDLGQTGGPDLLTGTEGSDVICGLAGDDQIEALGATDLVYGGPGLDTISGGAGGDYLNGGVDEAVIEGGPGADVCVSGNGTSCHAKNPADPNDAGGILDVKRVEITAADRWSWRVTTRGQWSLRRLWDDGYVIVYLDTRENERSDFYLLGRSLGRKMSGALFRDGTGRDARIGGVKVRHPTGHSARFLFDLDRIDVEPSRDFIRWSAQTILINGECAKACFDRVTNEGAVPMPID
jgi:Ca2+-binding RTX toxin-like protein